MARGNRPELLEFGDVNLNQVERLTGVQSIALRCDGGPWT
jgi:hypothetical protein